MRFTLILALAAVSGCASVPVKKESVMHEDDTVPDHFQLWVLELEGTRNYENLSTLAD